MIIKRARQRHGRKAWQTAATQQIEQHGLYLVALVMRRDHHIGSGGGKCGVPRTAGCGLNAVTAPLREGDPFYLAVHAEAGGIAVRKRGPVICMCRQAVMHVNGGKLERECAAGGSQKMQ
ncbi:hypothetical protein GCM10010970_11500 [Silvimonas iriomotensis]|uniref:Uncharacterized protein n=1 Tax=Silvimonas iriomotensis TaxID=449662 RepID=A0ABQ2P7K0_9NEIS|nr:hypothetical protein GCM10010970_11500 [Silvimonas iriomotensis]